MTKHMSGLFRKVFLMLSIFLFGFSSIRAENIEENFDSEQLSVLPSNFETQNTDFADCYAQNCTVQSRSLSSNSVPSSCYKPQNSVQCCSVPCQPTCCNQPCQPCCSQPCKPCDPCFGQPCQPTRCVQPCSPYAYVLIGGALGAGAGAATGYLAADGRGPRGKSFEFDKDCKECLTFVFDFTYANNVSSANEFYPFVTQPDGVTVMLEPFSVSGNANSYELNVFVSNPIFGLYSAGVFIGNESSVTTQMFDITNLDISVITSRDGDTTFILQGFTETITLLPFENKQISASYTYEKVIDSPFN